jgi:hypothetical protein
MSVLGYPLYRSTGIRFKQVILNEIHHLYNCWKKHRSVDLFRARRARALAARVRMFVTSQVPFFPNQQYKI